MVPGMGRVNSALMLKGAQVRARKSLRALRVRADTAPENPADHIVEGAERLVLKMGESEVWTHVTLSRGHITSFAIFVLISKETSW